MGPKSVPFSEAEVEILLNFFNENKNILLDPSNRNATVQRKNSKWAELASILSSKGTVRSLHSVSEKWHGLKKEAKRERDRTFVKKPTGGGKAREFSWKTKFIIETIGVEFHSPATISGGFDTSNFNPESNDEVNNESFIDNDYTPNDATLQNSNEILEVPTPSTSPSSSTSKISKKRSQPKVIDESGENTKETKYEEILNTQLEVYRLEKYKLLLEIDLLKAKRSRLGLPEEPETVNLKVYANL